MLAEIGLIALLLAFLAAVYAGCAAVYGQKINSEQWIRSARNAAIATTPLLLLAAAALALALISGQYQISYVWSTTDPQTPLQFRFTALWGSQAGSLLFWCVLMSIFSTAAIVVNWRTHHRLMPYAIAYMMAVLAFFVALVLFFENPFERFWLVPGSEQPVISALSPAGGVLPANDLIAMDARGLNPLLRHPGMIIHPPMLYLGFVGFIVPFAFAMSALGSGDLSSNWIKATRRWSLIAWLFLSLGLLLGGRWAYDVLGWGGYWGWDPVENAAFLPWLIGTAFLHSVMIQEKRGMLKVWNMFLVIGTFSAVIFGTFATRSGLIESVHSFARSEIGLPMFLFWGITTLVSVGLILYRWNRGELRDEHRFTNLLSRESLFVLNNVIFIALTIAIFWGSFGAPILSEIFVGTEITLGVDYFEAITPPLFIALYILMGVAPLSAWGATALKRLNRALLPPLVLTLVFVLLIFVTSRNDYCESEFLLYPAPSSAIPTKIDPILLTCANNLGALLGYGLVSFAGFVAVYEIYRGASARRRAFKENWLVAVRSLFARNRRRYGGYIVHLGIVVIGLGVIGSTLFQAETQRTVNRGESLIIEDYELRFDGLTQAQAVDGRFMEIADVTVFRNGSEIARLRPRHDIYPPRTANDQPMTMTIAGAHSTLENDFYVLLVGWQTVNTEQATFKVYINPLINLVWWGGLILMLGTFIAAWPSETVPKRVRAAAAARRTGAEATA